MNVAKSELDLLLSTEQKEQCKLEQLEQKLHSSTAGFGDKKLRIEEHSKAIPALTKKITGHEQDLAKYSGMYEELNKNVRSMRSNYEETRTNHAATKSRGKVHDALMKQKQNGSIKGSVHQHQFDPRAYFIFRIVIKEFCCHQKINARQIDIIVI